MPVLLPSPLHMHLAAQAHGCFSRFQPESSCISPVSLATAWQAPYSTLPTLAGILSRQLPALGRICLYTGSP